MVLSDYIPQRTVEFMSTFHALPPALARAHRWTQAQPWLWRFTLMNRLLLAMAFIPTGLVKATGNRFTILGVDNPVGFFFEAMYQTGPYWRFIGIMQISAALLLLIPRTAIIGALLFFPIGLSILLITWGVGFGNTVFVAAGMLLSVTYLICWDGDRVWAAGAQLFGPTQRRPLLAGAHWLERAGWVLGGMSGMGLLLITRSLIPNSLTLELFFAGVGAAVLVVAGWVAAFAQGRARTREA